jgi:hypothetical protein
MNPNSLLRHDLREGLSQSRSFKGRTTHAPGSKKLRLIVLGMMGRCSFGGQTWLYLNWLRGLAASGHEVWYVEDDSVWPYDPKLNTITDNPGYALRHIESSLDRVGLSGLWAFRLADRKNACWNLTDSELNDLYESADALLNIVGPRIFARSNSQARFAFKSRPTR